MMNRYPISLTYRDETVTRKTASKNLTPELLESLISQAFLIQKAFITKHVFWKKNDDDVQRPLTILDDFEKLRENHLTNHSSHLYIFDEVPTIESDGKGNDNNIIIHKSQLDDIIQAIQRLDDRTLHKEMEEFRSKATNEDDIFPSFNIQRGSDGCLRISIPPTNSTLSSFFSHITSEEELTKCIKNCLDHEKCLGTKNQEGTDGGTKHTKPEKTPPKTIM
ncbi:uncharacterized protein NDAI_0A06920 [Naumovozyma dairenensis CBS 421]|uniref:Uncharacterized protein n=1 Tax=Naumovozyma dairenensis (strain ATCC 10597 / BCRC 20456 / CBS 421 / NBRC 0211 / NRRL Y-12639) TaxID=1071378 RepID=G0W4V8_NAUDC|nr:hypothetical protein NDAI_0A06920 [Naumovozyma dairenensis CBS 421]CCD22846.1 hypothetical protein NDAI_0A06920 [Naumovozyma dairenensis CBS 421]